MATVLFLLRHKDSLGRQDQHSANTNSQHRLNWPLLVGLNTEQHYSSSAHLSSYCSSVHIQHRGVQASDFTHMTKKSTEGASRISSKLVSKVTARYRFPKGLLTVVDKGLLLTLDFVFCKAGCHVCSHIQEL